MHRTANRKCAEIHIHHSHQFEVPGTKTRRSVYIYGNGAPRVSGEGVTSLKIFKIHDAHSNFKAIQTSILATSEAWNRSNSNYCKPFTSQTRSYGKPMKNKGKVSKTNKIPRKPKEKPKKTIFPSLREIGWLGAGWLGLWLAGSWLAGSWLAGWQLAGWLAGLC